MKLDEVFWWLMIGCQMIATLLALWIRGDIIQRMTRSNSEWLTLFLGFGVIMQGARLALQTELVPRVLNFLVLLVALVVTLACWRFTQRAAALAGEVRAQRLANPPGAPGPAGPEPASEEHSQTSDPSEADAS